MTERSPRFSNGKKNLGVLIDEHKKVLARRTTFVVDPSPSDRERSTRFVRLSVLGAEVGLLLGDDHEASDGLMSLLGEGDHHLAIGEAIGLSLKVEIDPETGFFILHEGGDDDGSVFITASEERLLDHIVASLSSRGRPLASSTLEDAFGVLVGRSIEEVEWRLILKTFSHFRGNFPQAAFALGISTEALQLKVRALLQTHSGITSSESWQ